MKLYNSHKQVLARPMTRGDYNEYRGWAIPSDENPYEAGYLVQYPDSDNYQSWSPKDVFDRGYTEA